MTLDLVLADLRGEAAVLRANGHKQQAETLERACERVAEACPDYLRWLSLDEAVIRSGRSPAFLRGRAAEWEALGHARRQGRRWWFRAIVVPVKPLRAIERARGTAA